MPNAHELAPACPRPAPQRVGMPWERSVGAGVHIRVSSAAVRAVLIARRFLAIAGIVGWQVAVLCAGQIALLLALRGRARRQRFRGNRLAALCTQLGATFVKVGQIMSTRPDLLPPHIIAGLGRLQDNVGSFASRHIERAFSEDFGKPPRDLFSAFSTAPIASASVSQVHRATLADGTEVAVKVRRPRIEQIVGFDLAVMRFFARLLALRPSYRLLAPLESVNEFGAAIRMQIDFENEAENNRRFHENFAGDDEVVLPRVIPELSSRRILTMTFIEGKKVLEATTDPGERTRLAQIGFRILLKMVFADGFVHADLHPGNILVTPAGKVALLDVGLTATLDETSRRIFAQYFAAWAQSDGAAMARIMVEFSPSASVVDYSAFEGDVIAFCRRYVGKPLGEVQVSTVAFEMMGILRRHRVRVNPVFTMVNIAIAVTEGIGRQLDPSLDLLAQGVPFFAGLASTARL